MAEKPSKPSAPEAKKPEAAKDAKKAAPEPAAPAAPPPPSAESVAITGLFGRMVHRLINLPSSEHPINLNPVQLAYDAMQRLWKIGGEAVRPFTNAISYIRGKFKQVLHL